MKLPSEIEFHPDIRLLIYRPRGLIALMTRSVSPMTFAGLNDGGRDQHGHRSSSAGHD
jgi:hypothetical protein